MLIAKIVGATWMVMCFFLLLIPTIKLFVKKGNLFGCFFGMGLTWFLIGFLPIAIIKFGWSYIGRG